MTFIDLLVAELKRRADDRAAEDSPAAGVYRRLVAELPAMWKAYQLVPLSIEEGVAESGYTPQGLRAYMKRMGLTQLTRATLPRRGTEEVTISGPDPQAQTTVVLEVVKAPRRAPRNRRLRVAPSLAATVLP